jgi:hypothetical protein
MGLAGQGDFYKVISGRWRRGGAFRQSGAENLREVFELSDEVGLQFDLQVDEANSGTEDGFKGFRRRAEAGRETTVTYSTLAQVLEQQGYAAPGARDFEARDFGGCERPFEFHEGGSESSQRPQQSFGMD